MTQAHFYIKEEGFMEQINVSNPQLWTSLANIFGPGGLVLLITNLGTAYLVKMMFNRIKEKDIECQAELAAAAAGAMERANQMRDDIKEAFHAVADLSSKVTVLVDRSTRQA